MRYRVLLSIILAAAIIQLSVLDALRAFNFKPDLLLACAVVLGLTLELRSAIIFSALAGIFKDFIGANPQPLYVLLFPGWSALIAYAAKKISLGSVPLRAVFIFLAVLLNILVCRLIFFSAASRLAPGIFVRTLLGEALYTTLAAEGAARLLAKGFPLRFTPAEPGEEIDLEAGIE